jgi:hypothetical protein
VAGGAAAERGERAAVSRLAAPQALDGSDAIVTQPPGYMIRVRQNELDLLRFERLVQEADWVRRRSADAE